jgi:hypothetical protein
MSDSYKRGRDSSLKTHRRLVLLPWASIPLLLLTYLLTWSRLPDRLVTQVDWLGNPTGSMTRGQSLIFELATLAIVLSSFTMKLRVEGTNRLKKRLVTYYIAVGLILVIFEGMMLYNLN